MNDRLGEYIERLAADEPAWLTAIRRRAHKRYVGMEWPTRQQEEWRRTDISAYDFDRYSYGDSGDGRSAMAVDEVPEAVAGALSFVGDRCVSFGVQKEWANRGVVCAPLSLLRGEEYAGSPIEARIAELLGEGVEHGDNRFWTWQYSLLSRGALCWVPAGVRLDRPVTITLQEEGDGRVTASHIVVVVGREAQAQVSVQMTGADEGELLSLHGVDLLVDDAGRLDYTETLDLNLDSTLIANGIARVGRDAHLRHGINLFGGMLAKTRLDALLNGAGGDVLLDGIYFGHKDQQFDMRTVQVHNAPNATSRTFYKGAVKNEAHTIYQGLIRVTPDAPGTDAYLTNNNLLLDEGARSDSIPSLNIQTDDVKCSHGSTTGSLDALQRFYLQSRGYNHLEANALLVEGFFEKLIARCPVAMQERLRSVVSQRIME